MGVWTVAYWLVKQLVAKSNAPDLFWLIEELGGIIGKQQHSPQSVTKCIIVIGLLIKSKWIAHLKLQDILSFGCDTVDIKFALKVIVMYFRDVLRGWPKQIYFGLRNELGGTGKNIFTYVTDAVSGRDLEWGYDIRRKIKLECKSDSDNDSKSSENNENNINNINNECNDMYGNILLDIFGINSNINENNENILENTHKKDCVCDECIQKLFSSPLRKKQKNNTSMETDTDSDNDSDMVTTNNNNSNNSNISESNKSINQNNQHNQNSISSLNNQNNISNTDVNNNNKTNLESYAMDTLKRFVKVAGKNSLILGEKHILLDTMSLQTDGGTNYYGQKNGLHGLVKYNIYFLSVLLSTVHVLKKYFFSKRFCITVERTSK